MANFIKKKKEKKNKRERMDQERRIREYCVNYKNLHPDASDKTVLNYAFTCVYGKKGPSIVNRMLKNPGAFPHITNLSHEKVGDLAEEAVNAMNKTFEEEKDVT